MLFIFKNFSANYNASSLSESLSITARGSLKILKNLCSENLLLGKKFGRAVFYKVNLEDNYARILLASLLIKESREKGKRWLFEFEGIVEKTQLMIVYGSAVRNYKKAKDVDLLIVIDKAKYNKTAEYIEEKNNISEKPIHSIIMLLDDFRSNLEKRNPAMLNAVREGCVLHGQNTLIEVIKDFTKF